MKRKSSVKEEIKRNKKIYQLKKEGASYNWLANKFNITPQRIYQIIKREQKNESI